MRAIRKAAEFIDDRQLPLPRQDYLEMVEMCLKFNVFMLEDHEYAQQYGLAMGSPLSPTAACLFMELLEEEQFKNTGWSINNRTILNCSHFIARRYFFNPFSPKRSIHTGKLRRQHEFANA